jgi:exodeoxyribonuclease VII large subunit
MRVGGEDLTPGPFWLTVSQITQRIKRLVESSLPPCWVMGELSNVKLHRPSGHLYFSLKDEASVLRAVMFRRQAGQLGFQPAEGDVALAFGTLTVFERQGQYELIVEEMVPGGTKGIASLELDRVKEKLTAEGLFEQGRKRALPKCPATVGVVTSSTGAALRDIIRVVSQRGPSLTILLSPVLVQGSDAPASIVHGIECQNRVGKADVLIVGRGGGSQEDLWCFNDEGVVRAIAASRIPVISAVGHEVDVTLSDLAADARAPTPSAAGELAVPDRRELQKVVMSLRQRLQRSLITTVTLASERLKRLVSSHGLRAPRSLVQERTLRVDELTSRMKTITKTVIERRISQLKACVEQLAVLNPRAILERGYTLCLDRDTRVLCTSVDDVTPGEELSIVFHDGEVECKAH